MAAAECGLQMVSDDSTVWKSLFGPACTTVRDFENIINNKINNKKNVLIQSVKVERMR